MEQAHPNRDWTEYLTQLTTVRNGNLNVGTTHTQRTSSVALLRPYDPAMLLDDAESALHRNLAWIDLDMHGQAFPRVRLCFGSPAEGGLIRGTDLTSLMYHGVPVLGVISLPHKDSFCVLCDPIIGLSGDGSQAPTAHAVSRARGNANPGAIVEEMLNAIEMLYSESRKEMSLLCAFQSGSLVEVIQRPGKPADPQDITELHKQEAGLNDMSVHTLIDGSSLIFAVEDAPSVLIGRAFPRSDEDATNGPLQTHRFAKREFVTIPLTKLMGESSILKKGFFTYTAWSTDGSHVAATADMDGLVVVFSFDVTKPLGESLSLRCAKYISKKPYRIVALGPSSFAFLATEELFVIDCPIVSDDHDESNEECVGGGGGVFGGYRASEDEMLSANAGATLRSCNKLGNEPVPCSGDGSAPESAGWAAPLDDADCPPVNLASRRFDSTLLGIDVDHSTKLMVVAEAKRFTFFRIHADVEDRHPPLKLLAARWLVSNSTQLSADDHQKIPLHLLQYAVKCAAGHLMLYRSVEGSTQQLLCTSCQGNTQKVLTCPQCDLKLCSQCSVSRWTESKKDIDEYMPELD